MLFQLPPKNIFTRILSLMQSDKVVKFLKSDTFVLVACEESINYETAKHFATYSSIFYSDCLNDKRIVQVPMR